MAEMTLRQIEVIRAVMMTGTINGAAQMLNVSAPGISRLVKHTEESLGIRLFERKAGLFVPSMEASKVFDQVREVYKGVENLQRAVGALQQGEDVRLAFASAPSVAQFIAARVMQRVRARYADLFIDLNILKIEETVDYLLLERGEFVIMSSPVQNAAVENERIAEGRLVAIMPDGHPLAAREEVSVHDLAQEALIGIEPSDPYGRLLAQPMEREGLPVRHAMRGRFAQTLVSLVRHGLGVAVIDEFSVAEVYMPGVTRRPLKEDTSIAIYVVRKKGRVLSGFAEYAIQQFRRELAKAVEDGPWLRSGKGSAKPRP
ncbi:LysR family transcriptional regulator [Mameliella sediminis]|uniref:LysR family transcriptional regulator n=1 Tax=Mameliella sediminis TaxID=2836866 RepID=UPI001C481DBA|nr:LysR family transcriptional regulator [Mameliella sediminis]MBV7396796.1 LysR family transcriptional regulator [Mameliella sediminis]MBY6163087.1 LysR family transcriptional regulator [Mameliella alba]MBY6171351.1 LysR family transcriptional regulator [Mameliella alba]MBY6176575.1 LysR family transcriptional regulator [Mameliella alba]